MDFMVKPFCEHFDFKSKLNLVLTDITKAYFGRILILVCKIAAKAKFAMQENYIILDGF